MLWFCNVPVQETPENINESTNITTGDELTYWYKDKNGDGIYDVATASTSKIIFIEETETPYLEIITYCTKTKNIDHNIEKEEVFGEDKIWKAYNFYLPEYILKYQLN